MSLELIVTFKFINIDAKKSTFLLRISNSIAEHELLCPKLYYYRKSI